jgi:hypothetical protein
MEFTTKRHRMLAKHPMSEKFTKFPILENPYTHLKNSRAMPATERKAPTMD